MLQWQNITSSPTDVYVYNWQLKDGDNTGEGWGKIHTININAGNNGSRNTDTFLLSERS